MFFIKHETLRKGIAKRYGSFDNANVSKIAREMGVSRHTVTNWLYGDSFDTIDARSIVAWCKYLGCTMNDLIEFRMNGSTES